MQVASREGPGHEEAPSTGQPHESCLCWHVGLFGAFAGHRVMVSLQAVTETLRDSSLFAVIPPISNPLLSRQLWVITAGETLGSQ